MKKVKTLFVVVLFMCLTSLSLFAQYDNDPAYLKIVPSVIWAPASGGGTWYSEVQIWAETPGTEVTCYFRYGGPGYVRGGFLIWTSSGVDDCFKTNNILDVLAGLDPSFNYFGRSGGMEIWSVGGPIQVMVRTYHSGGYAKTICGLNWVDSNWAAFGRDMMIMNAMQSSSFRTFVTFFNMGAPCTVNIQIIQNGSVIGSFTKYIVGGDYQAFNVFAEAGLTGTYTNCFVLVSPQDTGAANQGKIFCSGATAHNVTNDPAYHVAMGWW